VSGASTCRITTRGRKTGKLHTVPIWFAAGDDGNVYLGTLKMNRDWPKNVAKNPDVVLEIGGLRLKGDARQVTEPAKRSRIESMLAGKYIVARIGSWFGLKPQGVFEVKVLGEAG
jgi:deazaflavin-dependent oxidoreductase (nitroreductase family)